MSNLRQIAAGLANEVLDSKHVCVHPRAEVLRELEQAILSGMAAALDEAVKLRDGEWIADGAAELKRTLSEANTLTESKPTPERMK